MSLRVNVRGGWQSSLRQVINYFNAIPNIDQAVTYSSPQATGFTVNIPDYKAILLITPAEAYATGTVNMPSKTNLIDGQSIEITITQTVTSIVWGVNGSAFVLNGPSALTAGQTVRFRYFSLVDWWVRI